MAKYMGRPMTRQDILRSVGHISQIAEVRSTEILTGRGGGSKALAVKTGSGLEFTVLQDKCMDIFDVRYKGINLGFIAKPGVTAPQYFDPINEFHHYFQGGMLFTCGLRNAGAGSMDQGEQQTLHGRIGNIPADNTGVNARWEGDEYLISLFGEMREAKLFGENLVLHRRIETALGEKRIKVIDRVDNENCSSEALMLLYHINFGFPFLGPDLKLMLPKGTASIPRDEVAASGVDVLHSFTAPVDGYMEQCFYHSMTAETNGDTCVLLRNSALDLAVYIKYNIDRLPVTTQWKCMASGDYALGIEPANCHVEGKDLERANGTLREIAPFGSVEFGFELGILEGAEIDEFICQSKLALE